MLQVTFIFRSCSLVVFFLLPLSVTCIIFVFSSFLRTGFEDFFVMETFFTFLLYFSLFYSISLYFTLFLFSLAPCDLCWPVPTVWSAQHMLSDDRVAKEFKCESDSTLFPPQKINATAFENTNVSWLVHPSRKDANTIWTHGVRLLRIPYCCPQTSCRGLSKNGFMLVRGARLHSGFRA